jgi:hypothetical protein
VAAAPPMVIVQKKAMSGRENLFDSKYARTGGETDQHHTGVPMTTRSYVAGSRRDGIIALGASWQASATEHQ